MAQAAQRPVDVLVVGAGAAGLAGAIALAQSGFSVVASGSLDVASNGRTVALFEGSLRFIRSLKLWAHLADEAAKIEAIEMIDATGSRVPIPRISFRAADVGLPALGVNIETNRLVGRLAEIAQRTDGIELCTEWLSDIVQTGDHIRAIFASGRSVDAKLIVAADGQNSTVRAKARIGTRRWSYPQMALTVLAAHAKPHHDRSIEFHTRNGPCTLVPLRPRDGAAHRSSLVWLMPASEAERRRALTFDALEREIAREVDHVFGAMRLDSGTAFFPMMGMQVARLAGRRVALLGEAAHVFPPLAAQGLNLSLRDIAALVRCLEAARRRGADIGSAETLRLYARARRSDIALRTRGIDVLNRSLLSGSPPVDLLRSFSSFALSNFAPLRRAVILEGILPRELSSRKASALFP